MHTIIDLIKKTEDFFKSKGIQNPRFSAETVLAEALNLDRIHLYTQFDRILTQEEIELCRNKLKSFDQSTENFTIQSLLNIGTQKLVQAHIENAEFDARELLSYVIEKPRLELSLIADQNLDQDIINHYLNLIDRRRSREPLQYIIGKVDFFGHELLVNKHVLIPRPETEQMIAYILSNLASSNRILDIGTGSGCIPIALKSKYIDSEISSVDKHMNSLNLASKNAERNNVDISFNQMDFLDESSWEKISNFDVIVSNPPYVTNEEYISLAPELTKYEPKHALTDFEDGLVFYRSIVKFCKDHLEQNGHLFLEHGDKQQNDIIQFLMDSGYFQNIQGHKDLNGFDRFISAMKV